MKSLDFFYPGKRTFKTDPTKVPEDQAVLAIPQRVQVVGFSPISGALVEPGSVASHLQPMETRPFSGCCGGPEKGGHAGRFLQRWVSRYP